MRIVRIITRLNIGGPAIQATTLAARLHGGDFDTLLVHGRTDQDEGDIRTVLDSGPLTSAYVRSLRRPIAPVSDAMAFAAVYRILCRFRPAIVHTHTGKAGTIGRLAALAYNRTTGRSRRARLVHTYHGHFFEGYFRPTLAAAFAAIERQLGRHTDAIVAISPRIRDDIVQEHRIGRPDQVRVVPLGFELGRFASLDGTGRRAARIELGLPAGGRVVTTVGRLVPIKQQWLFLEMAARVAARALDGMFLLAGDGPLRHDLERRASDLGMDDRVRFLGWRSDLPRLYAASDVFVLTSGNEGTPVALIEAMAAGVASVSTDVGGVRDVITGPETGALVTSGNVEALVEAVSSLLTSKRAREAMGMGGRASVLDRFGFDRLVEDLVALYHELV